MHELRRNQKTYFLRPCVVLLLGVVLNGCSGAAGEASKGGAERTYTVGGTVTGLTGAVILQNNGSDNLAVSADGTFKFTQALSDQAAYNVVVTTQPEGKFCSVANSRGTIAADNVTAISVACFTPVNLDADAGVRAIVLTWNSVAANSYNAYISSSANCDISAYQSCPDGAMHTNVTSPYEIRSLQNGKTYYAVVEAIDNKGHRALSPVAGARPNRLATNGPVWALTTVANGTVFLGGAFTEIGAASGNGVPLDLVRGRISNPNYPLIDGEVQKVISDGSGGWFIAGNIWGTSGKIAHILSDMTLDPFWQLVTAGQPINALAYGNDRLFVASPIVHSGYSSADTVNGLGAFKADGSLLAWHPDPNGTVTSLIVHNNVLYVGGNFTTIAGQPRNSAAAFAMDGTLLPWDPNVGGRVNAIAADGAAIFLGGFFGGVKGKAVQSLAAVDLNGDLRWGSDVNQSVWALTVHRGVVYAGGSFTQVGGQNCKHLIAINSDGTVRDWCPAVGGDVIALASTPGSDSIYLGGYFSVVNGQPRNGVAAVGIDGQLRDWDARIEEHTPYNSAGITALAANGSSLYVGGKFNLVRAARRFCLAAIDADGMLLKFDAGLNSPIYALANDGDVIYAGGYFSESNNQPRYGIASYDLNGVLRDWKPMLDGGVSAIEVDHSTRSVYLSGAFKAVNGIQRNSLAAVGYDGTLLPWAPNITIKYPDYLTSMALFNNMVYVGGRFSFALPGGTATGSNLAAFDMNGVTANWSPNPNGDVTSITANNDAVYLAGAFSQISGSPRASVASFGKDGMLTAWNPQVFQRASRFDLVVANGPTIYASYKPTSPASSGVVTAINPDSSFQNINIQMESGVSAMAIRDSSLFIGGDFTKIFGEPTPVSHFAKVDLTGRLMP